MRLKSTLVCYVALIFIVHSSVSFAATKSSTDEVNVILSAGKNFLAYPENDSIITEHTRFTKAIQQAASQLNAFTYIRYMRSWEKKSKQADSFEIACPILGFLHGVTDRSINNIKNTEIDSGLIGWYFYNMGYVIQTSTSKIGIDLNFRDAEKLAPVIDMLLITHNHHDHMNRKLIEVMTSLHKPVISNFFDGSIKVNRDTSILFNNVTVNVDVGDHHRHLLFLSNNNMLMYEIVTQNGNEKLVVYHSGDGNNFNKMTPSNPVDILITHVQLPMPLPKVITHIKPKITLVSHVMELSHPEKYPFPMRWNYDYCYKQINLVSGYKAITLIWGEKWILNGTKFHKKGSEKL